MKVTELHFSLTPSLEKYYRTKNSSPHGPISPNILNSTQVASYFKSHQSNKRLKYYSTKNKQANEIINQKNIEILKEQFQKFQDSNVRNIRKSKEDSNKEVFNLIVKKYYKKNKLPNQSIEKQKNKQQNMSTKTEKQAQIIDQDKQKQMIIEIQSVNPQLHTKDPITQEYPCQKQQSRTFIKQKAKPSSRGYSFPVTPKNMQRTVQIPSERLKRHRFNKSSITQLSHRNSFKLNNFISLMNSPCRKKTDSINNRSIKSSRSQRGKTSQAKRFIKLGYTDQIQNQNGESIDPYTNRQYLHVQLKTQNEKFKTLQKFLNSSIIESNMTKSFLIKTITPQVGHVTSDRVEKKYISMKQEFCKKIRSYSITNQKKKKVQKNAYYNAKKDLLDGWEINEKIVFDQESQIA